MLGFPSGREVIQMNVQNLRDDSYKLIYYMENNGYSKNYVDKFKLEIKRILALADLEDCSCFTDVYLKYTKTPHSTFYLRQKRTIIGAIEQFVVHARYPDRRRRHELFKRGSYSLLSPEFKSVIDYYCEVETNRGKKGSTIYAASHTASPFFLSLQKKGIDSLVEITEEAVLSIFTSPDGTLSRSCSYKKHVAAVIKACIPLHPETCQLILAFLPDLRIARKNIQYLTLEEINKAKEALSNSKNQLALCDKAIGILVLYTGLRGCDIAAMTLESIDWNRDLIYIEQQKTASPLELPLTAVVGNAIYDYLTSERPHTESRHLFVSQRKPYARLNSRSIGHVAARIMKAAGIRQQKGDRKGFHIFRHRFATTLLGKGVPPPVISKTLGHTSPGSLDAYLSADFSHLKECSIDIECFPVAKEVFPHE